MLLFRFYCSQEHQKADWKSHKKLCSYLATAAEEVGADTFFGQQIELDDDLEEGGETNESEKEVELEIPEDLPNEKIKTWKSWTVFRVNAAKMCAILIGRPLHSFEKEVFLFPRSCRVCRLSKKDGMLDCYSCLSVTYCSDQHRDQDLEKHKAKFCKELKYAMVCDNYESTVTIAAPPVPEKLDTKFALGSSMTEHLKWNSSNKNKGKHVVDNDVDLAEMEFRFLSDRLTGPLTILHAADKFGLAKGVKIQNVSCFTVHVVGANIVEMLGIIKWEYIAHRLPKLTKLKIVFIGLELDDEDKEGECPEIQPCDKCSDLGRSVIYEIRKAEYQDYSKSSHYIVPDMVAVFNCGFHEFEGEPEKHTWQNSLKYLTRHEDVPLLFTSYTLTEAEKDFKLVREAAENELQINVAKAQNPFRSHRPVRDFECDNDCDVFFCNSFYSVVRAKSN